MARTNIDIDEAACAVVMRRYHLDSKRAAVNFALRSLAAEPMDLDDARADARVGLGGRPRRHARLAGDVILVDTSAWVEFLRDTGSQVCERVDALLDSDVATCDPVRMEVLAGARDERHLHELRRLLARGTSIPTVPTDYEDAAAWYRTCRRNGDTVRKLVDCLIAAVAIRVDVELLHADADFEALARHTPLRLANL